MFIVSTIFIRVDLIAAAILGMIAYFVLAAAVTQQIINCVKKGEGNDSA